MPMLHENSSMRPEPKLDYIECAFGIKWLPKKTQKTPKKEIELALKIKKDYENEK